MSTIPFEKIFLGGIIMIFNELLLWVAAIIFLVGVVMMLEARLSSKIGLWLMLGTSAFFVYFFSSILLPVCVLFGVLALIVIRYLIAAR